MRNSLSASLLVTASIALVAALVAILGLQALVVHFEPAWLARRGLESTMDDVVQGLRFDAAGMPVGLSVSPTLNAIFDAMPEDVIYRVRDADGRIIAGSKGSSEPWPVDAAGAGRTETFFGFRLGDRSLHAMTTPLQRNGKEYYVQVAKSERFITAMSKNNRARERESAIWSAIVAIIVFGAAVCIAVHGMLQRLKKAADAAAHIDATNLAARLDTTDVPREIRPLVESFNSVLVRLEHGYRLQQDFLATAAHELKTPLTLMRGQVELGTSGNSDALLRDIDHMARQVHQLLHLAEVSERQNYSLVETEVMGVTRGVVEQLDRLAQAREVAVRIRSTQPEVVTLADPGALTVLLRNLIENAVHHAPAGSEVTVRVSSEGVRVRDVGGGVDPGDLPKLFQRFWRGKHRRDEGAGLGLAICREIAQFHRWTLSAANTSPGAEFQLDFYSSEGSLPT